MSNILYIHGYGSNKNSSTAKMLSKILGNMHNVFTNTYSLEDFDKTQKQIFSDIKRFKIEYVIGSSLGGFYALSLISSVRKIVINPCMFPSIEIPKIGFLTDSQIQVFKREEKELYSYIENEDKISTVGIFGKNDELINYQDFFKKKYGKDNFILCNGKHRLTLRQLSDTVPFALSLLPTKPFWESNPIPLFEHYVNATPTDIETKEKYKNEVF